LKQALHLEHIFLDSNADPLALELVRGDTNRKSWERIIRAPMKKKGHILLDYCTGTTDSNNDDNHSSSETTKTTKETIIRHKISRGGSA